VVVVGGGGLLWFPVNSVKTINNNMANRVVGCVATTITNGHCGV
jgi:hypothetical protein